MQEGDHLSSPAIISHYFGRRNDLTEMVIATDSIILPFRLVGYNISMKPPYEDDPNWITGWCPKCNDWKTFYHDSLSEKNRTKLLPSCPDCHTMIVQFQSRRSWRPVVKPKKYKRR